MCMVCVIVYCSDTVKKWWKNPGNSSLQQADYARSNLLYGIQIVTEQSYLSIKDYLFTSEFICSLNFVKTVHFVLSVIQAGTSNDVLYFLLWIWIWIAQGNQDIWLLKYYSLC